MLYDNASDDKDGNGISQVYAINTDGVFMTNPKNQYPSKKDVKFTTDSIGQVFQTDSPAVYFEKHYRENFNPDNYTMWEMGVFITVELAVVKHIDYAKRH